MYLRKGSKSFFVVVPNQELTNPMLHPDRLRDRFAKNADVNAVQEYVQKVCKMPRDSSVFLSDLREKLKTDM